MTCAKKHVRAELYTAQGTFVGTNDCENPQAICPRSPAMRNDYALCASLCRQPDHAETAAINAALDAGAVLDGAKMRIFHHRVCPGCEQEMRHHGIRWECIGGTHEHS